ncbi:MAG: PucR family transcriptional regulator [Lachnospiraceae bacterium]|nr:PucR family transcriptional regulator [Lachnospiraceae bacterium]
MAVTVRKMYQNGSFLYHMELIAGQKGLMNLVNWVHIIEDEDVSKFLHGNELVFTAGILNRNANWLLTFAKRLYEAGASAFVVNIGPYTRAIPEEVISFCDHVGMPLFTIPWETRMVDMTRDFCQRIINSEQVEVSISAALKNIIFKTGDFESHLIQLEKYGYRRESRFCLISISTAEKTDFPGDTLRQELTRLAEQTAKSIHDLFLSFIYKESVILVLNDYTEQEVEEFVDTFLSGTKKKKMGWQYHMGISPNRSGISELDKNFKCAIAAMEMACKRKETHCYYERLDIHKLLYAIEDRSVIRQYYRDTIAKLEQYDRENNTELTTLLRSYLFNNGSLQEVAEIHFLHRNTVTNQLKKIEKVLNLNPLELEDKVSLMMAFYIRDML